MSLMVSLDDVMKVLRRLLTMPIKIEDDEEWLRSEIEQKCYMINKRKDEEWADIAIESVEEVTSLKEIGVHLLQGDLAKWLETYRDNIIAQIVLAKADSQKKRMNNNESYEMMDWPEEVSGDG